MRTATLLLLLLLCGWTTQAQTDQCTLKLAELAPAPELFGFRMGMTTDEIKSRVPQVVFGKADEFAVVKTSINPDFDPRINKASFPGVRTISLDLLDGHLTSLWFGYDGTFKWQSVSDFVQGISNSLKLPDVWTTWRTRGRRLSCADFQLTVIMLSEGPSFRIIDDTAEQTIAARRQAKEDQESGANDEEHADEIVADKKAKVYYTQSCHPSHEIKVTERVVFKNRDEAEQAGYKPAKQCE